MAAVILVHLLNLSQEPLARGQEGGVGGLREGNVDIAGVLVAFGVGPQVLGRHPLDIVILQLDGDASVVYVHIGNTVFNRDKNVGS